MSILHLILGCLTFPGALLRAFVEHICLKTARVPVEDTDYIQKNEMFGHVEHKPVTSLSKGMGINLVPGLLLFLVGAGIIAVSGIQLFYLGLRPVDIATGKVSALFILCAVLYWFGAALWCRIFPTYEDALFLWEAYTRSESKAAKLLLFLPCGLIRVGAFAERFGIWTLCVIAGSVVLFLI